MRRAPVYSIGAPSLLELAASDAGYEPSVAALFRRRARRPGSRFQRSWSSCSASGCAPSTCSSCSPSKKALVVTGSDPKRPGCRDQRRKRFRRSRRHPPDPPQLDGRTVLDVHFEPGTFIIEAGTPSASLPSDDCDPGWAAVRCRCQGDRCQQCRLGQDCAQGAASGDGHRRRCPPSHRAPGRAQQGAGQARQGADPGVHGAASSAGAAANGASRGVGRPVRLHLRAGHFRRQPHGRGSTERKLIFIRPVLIGYRPGNEASGRSARCGYDGRSQVRRDPGRSISGPDPALGFSLDPFQTDIRACILHCDRRRRTLTAPSVGCAFCRGGRQHRYSRPWHSDQVDSRARRHRTGRRPGGSRQAPWPGRRGAAGLAAPQATETARRLCRGGGDRRREWGVSAGANGYA